MWYPRTVFICALLILNSTTLLYAQSNDFEKMKERMFLSTLSNQLYDLEYVFAELSISTDQQKRLLKKVQKLKAEASKLNARGQGEAKLDEIVDEFGRGVESILLPHQGERLRGLFLQRFYQKRLGLEIFEIPFHLSKELALSENENQSLETATDNASKTYGQAEKDKEIAAWKDIKDAAPTGIAQQIDEYTSGNKPPKSFFVEMKRPKMISDHENLDVFEETIIRGILLTLPSDPQLSDLLAITGEQKKQILQVVVETIQKESELNDRLKEESLEQKRSEIVIDFNAKILDELLLPHQATWIKNSVKRERLMLEMRFGDQFGLPVAWAQMHDMPAKKKEKFVKTIESVRTEFHEELKSKRLDAYNSVLQSLSAESQDKLKEMLGDPYDYRAEVVAEWDRVRKKMSGKLN